MPKARRLRQPLERRFEKLRQRGSHVIFRVGDGTATFAYTTASNWPIASCAKSPQTSARAWLT